MSRKTNGKNEKERLERMFQRIMDLLIILLAVTATMGVLKLVHEKSTMQDVPAPPGFNERGDDPEVLVEGEIFSPIPPPLDDGNSPTDPPWFSDSSTGGEGLYNLVPVLKPKVKPRRAIRRVVRNSDWETIYWEIDQW